jgi:urease accessory protein
MIWCATINHRPTFHTQEATFTQPRAIGAASVVVRGDQSGKTRLANLRQSGCMKLVFPKMYRNDIEAVLVNTSGGITGGDTLAMQAHAKPGAMLTLTTQAAERAYRAQDGEVGKVTTHLTVEDNAQLNWMPQELILYDRCALSRRLMIDLQGTAQLLMVEPVVFGRKAMREVLHTLSFRDRIEIRRDGKPLYLDGMDLSGDAVQALARPALANGAGAMASVVFVHPDAAGHLQAVRAMLPASGGASMLTDDLLVIRCLAPDSFELRRALMPVLEHLSQKNLPISWRL